MLMRLRYWRECLRYLLRDPWDDVGGEWAARIEKMRQELSQ